MPVSHSRRVGGAHSGGHAGMLGVPLQLRVEGAGAARPRAAQAPAPLTPAASGSRVISTTGPNWASAACSVSSEVLVGTLLSCSLNESHAAPIGGFSAVGTAACEAGGARAGRVGRAGIGGNIITQ